MIDKLNASKLVCLISFLSLVILGWLILLDESMTLRSPDVIGTAAIWLILGLVSGVLYLGGRETGEEDQG